MCSQDMFQKQLKRITVSPSGDSTYIVQNFVAAIIGVSVAAEHRMLLQRLGERPENIILLIVVQRVSATDEA